MRVGLRVPAWVLGREADGRRRPGGRAPWPGLWKEDGGGPAPPAPPAPPPPAHSRSRERRPAERRGAPLARTPRRPLPGARAPGRPLQVKAGGWHGCPAWRAPGAAPSPRFPPDCPRQLGRRLGLGAGREGASGPGSALIRFLAPDVPAGVAQAVPDRAPSSRPLPEAALPAPVPGGIPGAVTACHLPSGSLPFHPQNGSDRAFSRSGRRAEAEGPRSPRQPGTGKPLSCPLSSPSRCLSWCAGHLPVSPFSYFCPKSLLF